MRFLLDTGASSSLSSSEMHNLKTRIKRGKNSPKKGSTEECVDDWQFVNFNPFIFNANPGAAGNRRSLAFGEIPCSSSNSVEHQNLSGAPFISGGREDFYEFPTSTKFNLKRNSHDEALHQQQKPKEKDDLLKNLQRRSLQNVPADLFPPTPPSPPHQSQNLLSFEDVGPSSSSPPKPPRPPLPLPIMVSAPLPLPPSLKKSNSVLSTSSSSGSSSLSSPSNSNPVSRSSSRGKDESLSRSTFYVPPALPPKGGRLRTSALSLALSPPETQLRAQKKGPPPPPPQSHDDFMDFDELDLISALNTSIVPAPPPPPPYPKEGLGRLIQSNNLSKAGARPLSWDLNLKAGTMTLLDGGTECDLSAELDNNHGAKKSKRPPFYHVHLHGRKKDKGVIGAVVASSPPKPGLSSSSNPNSGPPLPLKPRQSQGHTHHHPNHLYSTHYTNKAGNGGGVANLCLNLTTIKKPLGGSGSSLKGDRRPDTLSEERIAPDGFTFEDGDSERVHDEPKKPSTAVGRSESCKERVQRKQTRERRKHSDPNLSKSNDVDLDNQRQLSDANNSGSSSNSSLSLLRSLESPSTSLELVAPSNNSSSSLRERSSETPETTVGNSSEPFKPSPGWDGDSDIEIDQDPPDWTKNVPEETLSSLDRLEKNRQEVLNELFHTERSHVRNLKVVDRLFHRPIRQQQLLPENLIQMLFANLDEMLEIHGRFNSALKKLRMEAPLIGDIGPVLLEMFDGESGDNFKRAAATFCAKQQIGLENLRDKRRKDARFNSFLTESELDSVCRRLGIKDMIPMAMQRLTKYPLLFENLCNCTASDSEEYKHIQRAVELSKDILTHVNSAKKEAEDQERLIEIQRKLDKPSFEKGIDKTDPSISEIRNLDFTKHRLIYEGPLMWRMTKSTRQKSDLQEVQAVLLDSLIVILLKQDDRYVLKIHNIFPGKSDRMMAKPIIKLNNLHHRPVATDKRAFFLISTTSSNMYELVCSTAEERNVWFHHITKAADDYKNRQETRRSENLQNSNSNSISSTTAATNIPSSLASSDVQGKDVGADGDGEKDSSGQLFPPMATPSVSKEPSPAPESTCSDPIQSPGSPEKSGDGSGRLQVQGTKVSRSASMGGRPKEGEFLQITQSSPLVDPSEVVVTSRDIQFAQAVLSPHEELRRADLQVQKALEEKLRIASKLFHIPPTPTLDDSSVNILCDSKDAKEVIVKCINNVDRLIGIVSNQKSTKEYSESNREQQIIHANLNKMLTHILSEFERKEEELELRRQELHRVREQNHGYQDRLQNLSVSSVASPSHSRPSSLITDHHSHDEEDAKTVPFPSKPLSSDLVATSNSEEESGATLICNPTLQSCDSAQNFADATSSESRLLKRDSDAEGGEVEKNRDCPETEVLIVTTAAEPQLEAYQDDSSSSSSKPAVTVPDDKPLQQQQENEDEKSNGDLLLVTTNGHNGESTSDSDQAEVKSAISSKKSDCNVLPENDSSTDLQGEAKETA
ncbi:uncharacterized protein LOC110844861 isoform X9 [Folsomia candida]|uniref:uncharacterized protein LOC110844861 isoform X9 n=1 Tax=Folsomia candida TaxID=158441 RepID=UPI001604F774|nr:uncharacterized protein LOC110844861 isoform X9 [Folsomia candida]